jgi:hypothetical protein
MVWRWTTDDYFAAFVDDLQRKALEIAKEEERDLVIATRNAKLYKYHEVQFRSIVSFLFQMIFLTRLGDVG